MEITKNYSAVARTEQAAEDKDANSSAIMSGIQVDQ